MANYTITRVTDVNDIYGCTNFQTTETEGETAILSGGPNSVDGDIVWHIDANNGYTVSVPDFSIPGATAPSLAPVATPFYSAWEGGFIPLPVLGVIFEQISLVRIRVTLFLTPSAVNGITGTTFTMPSGNISVQLPIDGCANKTNTGL